MNLSKLRAIAEAAEDAIERGAPDDEAEAEIRAALEEFEASVLPAVVLALLDVVEAAETSSGRGEPGEIPGRACPDSIAGVPVDKLYEGMGK